MRSRTMKLHKWDDIARSRVGAEKLSELRRKLAPKSR
jgi:hypothetical protein